MLTPRQEKFCLEYAACGKAAESYIKAGYTSKKNSVMVLASKLLRNPMIIERLKELADEVKQEKIAGVVECQEILTAIARNEEAADADRIKAIHVLMKMQGAYATQINFKTTPIVIAGGDQLED